MTKDELIALLDSTAKETTAYFELDEKTLVKSYGEGKWNIRQILHHLVDTETLLNGRLKKVIAEPRQVVYAFSPDDWNAAFDYKHADLAGKKDLYLLFRKQNRALTEQYFDTHGGKEFIHNITGLRTLKDEFEKVGIHNRDHNKQIQIALSK